MFVFDLLRIFVGFVVDGFVSGVFFFYGGVFSLIASVVGLFGLYLSPLDVSVYTAEYIAGFLEVRPALSNLCFVGVVAGVVSLAVGFALMSRVED